jgi:hypothetical protein
MDHEFTNSKDRTRVSKKRVEERSEARRFEQSGGAVGIAFT